MHPPGQHSARLVPFNPQWYWATIMIRVSILLIVACIWGLLVLYASLGLVIMPPLVIVPLLVSDIVWQFAEIILLAIRWSTTKRGIHPVAHLVENLVHMLAYLTMAILHELFTISASEWDDIPISFETIGAFLFLEWYVFEVPHRGLPGLTVSVMAGSSTLCSFYATASRFINEESQHRFRM